MVGMTGFEPAAPTSRTWCATKLRYIPKFIYLPKTLVLGGCATPLTKQYSIVLFGRVLHPEVYIFTQNSRFGWVRYPSHKTILNCFVRQSATSRSLYIYPKLLFWVGALSLSQNNTQLFCSAECYILEFAVFNQNFRFGWMHGP